MSSLTSHFSPDSSCKLDGEKMSRACDRRYWPRYPLAAPEPQKYNSCHQTDSQYVQRYNGKEEHQHQSRKVQVTLQVLCR